VARFLALALPGSSMLSGERLPDVCAPMYVDNFPETWFADHGAMPLYLPAIGKERCDV
jgi:hypothetical protein